MPESKASLAPTRRIERKLLRCDSLRGISRVNRRRSLTDIRSEMQIE